LADIIVHNITTRWKPSGRHLRHRHQTGIHNSLPDGLPSGLLLLHRCRLLRLLLRAPYLGLELRQPLRIIQKRIRPRASPGSTQGQSGSRVSPLHLLRPRHRLTVRTLLAVAVHQ
jgi:hypothetical protein